MGDGQIGEELGHAGDRGRTCCLGTPYGRARRRASFCPSRSNQRHTAGCPAFEVRITYRFHPRAGDFVTVVGVRRHASADHLIVRQPDCTLALLPAWMTKTNGSSCELIQHPRLPLERLAELHALVGTLLISLRGDSPSTRGAGDDERATQPKRFIRTSNDASRAFVPSPDGAHAAAPGTPDGSGRSGNRGRDGRSDRRGGR